jgi:hypothetical protein
MFTKKGRVCKLITGIVFLVLLLCNRCHKQSRENTFLAKYEFEDFSSFKDLGVFKRGESEDGRLIMIDVPYITNDSLFTGLYLVRLGINDNRIVEAEWVTKHKNSVDTLTLQQVAQSFVKYEISGLEFDGQGNVFIYLDNFEELSLIRFDNDTEVERMKARYDDQHDWERYWKRIRGNWYRSKVR